MSLLVLLACHTSPWTQERAFTPALARLDTDRDGRVVAAEYARVDFGGPRFDQADADADGALSLGELRALATQDPVMFYVDPTHLPPSHTGSAPDREAATTRLVDGSHQTPSLLVLQILVEELAAAEPTAPLPDEARIRAIGAANTLDSPDARALLRELEEASLAAGLLFPPALSQRGAPSGPTGPPEPQGEVSPEDAAGAERSRRPPMSEEWRRGRGRRAGGRP